MVLGRAQEHANARLLVRFLHVPIEGLQVEFQLAQMFRLKLLDLQLEGDQAIERSIEEQQVQHEIPSSDLEWVVAADKTEIAAQFDEECPQFLNQPSVQVGFRVTWW